MKRLMPLRFFAALLLGGLATLPVNAQVVTENYNGAVLSNPKTGLMPTSTYRAANSFSANGFNYSVVLQPLHPLFQDDPTANFLSTLTNQATNPAGKLLTFGDVYNFSTVSGGGPDYSLSNGSIEVRRYTAEASGGSFGLDFWADYKPSAAPRGGVTDPNGASMHWIQVINDNWNISDPMMANRGPGKPENIVDVDITPPQGDPYYDNGGAANNAFFLDTPRRPQGGVTGGTYFWNAELFVVKDALAPTFNMMTGDVTQKGTIQIYDGVRYGFIATTPEFSVIVDIVLLGGGAFAVFWYRRRLSANANR